MRTILLTILACLSCLGVCAQDQSGKPVVYIGHFTGVSEETNVQTEALRSKVIEGIQATNRVEVIDVSSQEELQKEVERRKQESAMGDATARSGEMKTLASNYLITADISYIGADKKTDSEGKIYYLGIIRWTIKVINVADGTLKTTKSFDHSGLTGKSGDTPNQAIIATCDYAKVSMKDFVDDTFPMEGLVLKVETTNKKGTKAETVFIDLGSARGIMKGQRFSVYQEVDMAGEVVRTEIGALNAQEVLSANRTLCKVNKGGEEVLKAMKEGQKLIIVSRRMMTFLDNL